MTVIKCTGHHWIGSAKIPTMDGAGVCETIHDPTFEKLLAIVYWVRESIVARDAAFGMP